MHGRNRVAVHQALGQGWDEIEVSIARVSLSLGTASPIASGHQAPTDEVGGGKESVGPGRIWRGVSTTIKTPTLD